MDPGQTAPSSLIWAHIVFFHKKSSVNFTWIYTADVKSRHFKHKKMSHCMGFPTMWYVRPARPQISLRIWAVWSEPLLVPWIFYDCWATDRTSFGVSKLKRRLQRFVWVYSCQNATLMEITCHGSFIVCHTSWKFMLSCLKDHRRVASLRLTGGPTLCPWGRHFILWLVLVQWRDWKIVDWGIKHQQEMSQCMRFPTMWYVWPAKPQISLHIRAVWSEPLLVA